MRQDAASTTLAFPGGLFFGFFVVCWMSGCFENQRRMIMVDRIGRRALLASAGAALVTGAVSAPVVGAEKSGGKIVGVSCSYRKGKTTVAAVQAALDAAAGHASAPETYLIDLAEMSIPGYMSAGQPLRENERDDFPAIASILGGAEVTGIIVGSPVYFGTMSALCKAFLERCVTFRKDNFRLRGKVAGVVAVGGTRNGGQELTVQGIKTALMGQDVLSVGTGPGSTRIGATLWNQNDSISADDFGLGTARDLGRHVAEIASRLD
jgi:multimeric flavodoxin WrbA